MKRINTVLLLCTLMLFVCSVRQSNAQRKQPIPFSTEEQGKKVAELKLGEASGTIKAGSETVGVRYAYAGWVRDEDNAKEQMIELLLTDQAIPKAKLALAFAGNLSYQPNNKELLGRPLRGIRFHIKKDGSVYQKGLVHLALSVSGMLELYQFRLEGDQVSGADEERNHGIDDDRWGYSVSFIASVSK